MNEKNLTEIDSDKENENPIAENAEDNIAENEAPANVAKNTLENAETSCEDEEDTPESTELYAEDAEDTDLAFEDEDLPSENTESYDIEELKKSFPELSSLGSLSDLLYPEKYAKSEGLGSVLQRHF